MLEPSGGASAVPADLARFSTAANDYVAELRRWAGRMAGDERLASTAFAIRSLAARWERLAANTIRTARDFAAADMVTIALIDKARSQVGYHEGRYNESKYGRWYGLNHEAWCAMFVSWAFAQAGEPLPAIQGRKGFAKVAEGFRWGRANGRLAKQPRVGDIFLISHDGNRGHTGIVVAVNSNGTIRTIEGNTNTNGSRNGDGVYERTRAVSSINAGFLRINGQVSEPEAWKGPNMFKRARTRSRSSAKATRVRRRTARRNRRNR